MARAGEHDIAASRRHGGEIGARFDPVRHHPVRRAVQARDALHDDAVGTGALNARAHRSQASGQINHFGLARRVFDDRFTLGQDGGHHQIFGTRHRNQIGDDACAFQAVCPARAAANFRFGDDIAMFDAHRRAKNLQPLDVLIHRARANRATAWQGHARGAEARHQRTQHEDRRAHRLDHLVGRNRVDWLLGAQRDARTFTLNLHPHLL